MTPTEWAVRPLKKYVDFTGRAPRAEYWWFYLLTFVVSFAANVLDIALLSILVSLGLIIPSLAVSVRRLHDTDRSGWWLLLPIGAVILFTFLAMGAMLGGGGFGGTAMIGVFILVVAALLLFIFMLLPGTPGPNRYGQDPYADEKLDEVFA